MVEGSLHTFAEYNVSVTFDDNAKKIRIMGDVSPFEFFYFGFIGNYGVPSHLGEFVNWGKEFPKINARTGYFTFDFPIDCVPAVEYGRYCLCFKIKDTTLYHIVSIVTKKGGVSADGSVTGARGAIESLYKGRCKVIELVKVFDSVTKQTAFKEAVVCSDEPCRLSYTSKTNADTSDTVSNVSQVIKLFIKPELAIKAGSKIEVKQNGVVVRYVSSGQPAVYSNHQEVVLELEGDKA